MSDYPRMLKRHDGSRLIVQDEAEQSAALLAGWLVSLSAPPAAESVIDDGMPLPGAPETPSRRGRPRKS